MKTIFLIILVCLVFGIVYILASIKKKGEKVEPVKVFAVDLGADQVVNDYVERMPNQYKDNARLLQGVGKMHFSDAMSEGSQLIDNEQISVLNSIGERFS